MEHVIQLGLSNAAAATVLAILAAIATRIWRNPHFGYALWLVVLLRLVAPPLVPVQVPLPAWAIVHSTGSAPIVAGPTDSAARSSTSNQLPPARRGRSAHFDSRVRARPVREVGKLPATQADRIDGSLGGCRSFRCLPLFGSEARFFMCCLSACGARRFSLALDGVRREVCESLRCEAAAVAATIGLRRLPRLALIEAPLPPMVWPGWRPTVLLPRGLVDSLSAPLSPPQRRLLLFARVAAYPPPRSSCPLVPNRRRGNPLVEPDRLVGRTAARAGGRECCDAAVLYFHPDQSEGYGQTLFCCFRVPVDRHVSRAGPLDRHFAERPISSGD